MFQVGLIVIGLVLVWMAANGRLSELWQAISGLKPEKPYESKEKENEFPREKPYEYKEKENEFPRMKP